MSCALFQIKVHQPPFQLSNARISGFPAFEQCTWDVIFGKHQKLFGLTQHHRLISIVRTQVVKVDLWKTSFPLIYKHETACVNAPC